MDLQSLEALGITKEDLFNRIVDKAVTEILESTGYDEDGDEVAVSTKIEKDLRKLVKERVDAKIVEIGDKHILPRITELVEGCCIKVTNGYGEKKAEPMGFVEYMISRAEAYLREEVDHNGKSKSQNDYNFRGTQTRVTHLVEKHLHYTIETAMQGALKNANASIIGGINDAVKIKLAEVAKQFSVQVKTK